MKKAKPTVLTVKPTPPGKRYPWYRWIRNCYRGGRNHGYNRRGSLDMAIRAWWQAVQADRDETSG